MKNDNLLIPCEVEAWVVDNDTMGKNTARFVNTYGNLKDFTTPENHCFSSDAIPKKSGVYLHWKLPPGLRHGLTVDGSIQYPEVPNRWLVLRVLNAANGKTTKGWVIESNYIDDPRKIGATYPGLNDFSQILLGRSVCLSEWPDKHSKKSKHFLKGLTAVGSGDINFSTFQPYHPNVFSFHDPLQDNNDQNNIDEGELSYFIMGWYSNKDTDPLSILNALPDLNRVEQWAEKIKNNFFCMLSENDSEHDKANLVNCSVTTLCHGMSNGIIWDRLNTKEKPEPEPEPSQANINLAIGNTALDALSALSLGKEPSVPDLLLDAFNHGLLDKLDDVDAEILLEHEQHQSGFATISGDIHWTISILEEEETADKEPTDFPDEISTAVNQLNQMQAQLDVQNRILQSAQWELYMLWFKIQYATVNKEIGVEKTTLKHMLEKMKSAKNDLRKDASVLKDQIDTLNDSVAAKRNHLNKLLTEYTKEKKLPPYTTKSIPTQNFWRPRDPIVLITGIKSPGLEKDHSDCRLLSQLPQGKKLIISSDKLVPKDASEVSELANEIINILLPNENFPFNNLTALIEEFLLISDILSQGRTELKSSAPNYTLPSYGTTRWQQPWCPLFLEWELEWYRIPFKDWDFIDNKYSIKREPKIIHSSQPFFGRTFLTPHASFSIKHKLIQLVQQLTQAETLDPEDPLMKILTNHLLIEKIEKWDVLSQSLSGLHLQFIHQDPRMNRILSGIGDENTDLHKVIQDQMRDAPVIPPNQDDMLFQPVRHGQFVIESLRVIDRFGQLVDIINKELHKTPIISKLLKADKLYPAHDTSKVIQLSPRIVQAARLHFDWLHPNDITKTLDLNAEINPICGWLLPNYLDSALQIYSPEGWLLAELFNEDNRIIFAQTPSEHTYTCMEKLQEDYPQLGNMLSQLTPTYYHQLFDIINQALATKISNDTKFSRYYSALMGKPLALARAQWQLDLAQLPYPDQSWEKTKTLLKHLPAYQETYPLSIQAEADDPLCEDTFPVHLGDPQLITNDGLIGYFLDGQQQGQPNYNQFYSVYPLEQNENLYIKPIRGNEFKLSLTKENVLYTTLLLDPTVPFHAYSDILPVMSQRLPSHFVEQALKTMEITFRVGPILAPVKDPDEKTMQMPTPGLNKAWRWIENLNPNQPPQDWPKLEISPTDTTVHFSQQLQPYELVDGWLSLKLSEANMKINNHAENDNIDAPSNHSSIESAPTATHIETNNIQKNTTITRPISWQPTAFAISPYILNSITINNHVLVGGRYISAYPYMQAVPAISFVPAVWISSSIYFVRPVFMTTPLYYIFPTSIQRHTTVRPFQSGTHTPLIWRGYHPLSPGRTTLATRNTQLSNAYPLVTYPPVRSAYVIGRK